MRFPKQDVRNPSDIEQVVKLVRTEDFEGRMLISADPDRRRAYILRIVDLGFDHVYLQNVGQDHARGVRARRAAQAAPMTVCVGDQLCSEGSDSADLRDAGRRSSNRTNFLVAIARVGSRTWTTG